MAAKDDAYSVNIEKMAKISTKAGVNQELMATADTMVHMNCYEDEVLYIVEGAGVIQFENKNDLPFEAEDLVCLPSDQYHGIHADLTGRTKLLYFMKPDYKSVRRQDPDPLLFA